MAMILNPYNGTHYPDAEAGTIESLALHLQLELSNSGYSLLDEDVLGFYLIETQYYAAWAMLECQKKATNSIMLDKDVTLMAYEWAIIDPVIRAHCDMVQAHLIEACSSLGWPGFNLTVNEATQIYKDEREKLQKAAFCEKPFSFKTLGGL